MCTQHIATILYPCIKTTPPGMAVCMALMRVERNSGCKVRGGGWGMSVQAAAGDMRDMLRSWCTTAWCQAAFGGWVSL
jgi:hypothetical protein